MRKIINRNKSLPINYFIIILFVFCIQKNKIFSMGAPLAGTPSNQPPMNLPPTGTPNNQSIMGSQPSGLPQTGALTTNQNKWQKVETAPITYQSENFKQFNWQQRKVLKQKVYSIYIEVLKTIEDISDMINKYNLKKEDINILMANFDSEIIQKCSQIHPTYKNPSAFYPFITNLQKSIQNLKKGEFYKINKDFRESIESKEIDFSNAFSMIDHYEKNINEMYNLENIIISSLENLYNLESQAKQYENDLWNKYQKLDELIPENVANDYYSEIVNNSDNITQIDSYIRENFLSFFNESLSNLNFSNAAILSGISEFITYIQKINIETTNLENSAHEYHAQKEKDFSEKLIKEEEEKRIQEERLKEEKRKQEKNKQKESIYKKILNQVILYAKQVEVLGRSVLKEMENTFLKYYHMVFPEKNIKKKNSKKIEKNVTEENEENTIVNQSVSQIVPQQDRPPLEFVSPRNIAQSHTVNPVESQPLSQTAPQPQKNVGMIIDNTFEASQQPQPIAMQEKEKEGGSSYPQILNPEPQQTTATQPQQPEVPQNTELQTTEVIPQHENIDHENEHHEETNNPQEEFHYQGINTDNYNNTNEQEDNLLAHLKDNIALQPTTANIQTEFARGEKKRVEVESQGKKTHKRRTKNKKNESA